MLSSVSYTVVIAATAVERLFELKTSLRNAKWSFEQGAEERGQEHYLFMVVLHTAFLIACPAEVWLLDRPFLPWLGWPMLLLAILCQGLRWWCITTLGKRWNTRVIILPGQPKISTGPYRYFSHPNYIAVAVEGVALPLIHSAWLTAIVFSILNAYLMWLRIRCENAALAEMIASEQKSQ